MEPLIFIGGTIVLLGGIWTVLDLLQDIGISKQRVKANATQAYSGFKSRDISSSTACRTGLAQ